MAVQPHIQSPPLGPPPDLDPQTQADALFAERLASNGTLLGFQEDGKRTGIEKVRILRGAITRSGDDSRTRTANAAAIDALRSTFRSGGGLGKLGREAWMGVIQSKGEQMNPEVFQTLDLMKKATRGNLGKMSEEGMQNTGIQREHFEKVLSILDRISMENSAIRNLRLLEEAKAYSLQNIKPRIDGATARLERIASGTQFQEKRAKQNERNEREGFSRAANIAKQGLSAGATVDEIQAAKQMANMLFKDLPTLIVIFSRPAIHVLGVAGGYSTVNAIGSGIRSGRRRGTQEQEFFRARKTAFKQLADQGKPFTAKGGDLQGTTQLYELSADLKRIRNDAENAIPPSESTQDEVAIQTGGRGAGA